MSPSPSLNLATMLEATSIAVVGASPNPMRPGGRCLSNLAKFGFPGPIYPVNPKREAISGLRCYPNLIALPEVVDLVILAAPAASVLSSIGEAAEIGAKSAVVFASGFAETGDEGERAQEAMAACARGAGIALLGPNTAGFADLSTGVISTFTSALDEDLEFRPGPVAVVSQSGAVSAAVFTRIQQEGVGSSVFVGTGNEAVLDAAAFIDYLSSRGDIGGIVGYLEGVGDGARLSKACRRARNAGKLVSLLKVGDTMVGGRMVQSHTRALTTNREIFNVSMRDAGVVLAESFDELVDHALGVSSDYRPAGRRTGIVSMSGGAAVMMSDRCEQLGLIVEPLSPQTLALLSEILPGYAARSNPVDYGGLAGDPEKIVQCIRTVAEDPAIDQVLLSIGTSPFLKGFIEARLDQIRHHTGKPITTGWIGGPRGAVRSLREHLLPAFGDPYRATSYAFAQAAPAPAPADELTPSSDAAEATTPGATNDGTPSTTAFALLARYGIPCAESCLVRTAEEARAWVTARPGRFAVKAEAEDLIHKTEIGAVRTDVAADALEVTFEEVIAAARMHGFRPVGALLQEMIYGGIELIIGGRQDASFGPVVIVGFGGVNTELLRDTQVFLPSPRREKAHDVLRRLRGYPLLAGFRGSEPADVEAVTDAMVGLAQLLVDHGDKIDDVDLNPVIVHPRGQGCTVVDASLTLRAAPIEAEVEVPS